VVKREYIDAECLFWVNSGRDNPSPSTAALTPKPGVTSRKEDMGIFMSVLGCKPVVI
jgi:hypothetical protein